MQKFKVSKQFFLDYVKAQKAFGFDFVVLPDFFILEGGTVEKVGWVCKANNHPNCLFVGCACPCHNKKEEKSAIGDCMYGGFCIHHLCKDFNRETPKEKIAIVPSGRIDYCVKCDAEHGYDCPKEEVKLPEKLTLENLTDDYYIGLKINEILTYLASKEAGDK